MVDMVDPLQFGVAEQGDGVEAWHLLAHRGEGGLERAQRLHRGFGTHMFVMVEDDLAHHVANGDDRFGEAALVPRHLGALLALDGIGVGIVAADAEFGGDDVRANALGREIGFVRDRRVHGERAAIRRHGHAAHGFDAATDGEQGFARQYFRSGDVDGFEAGGAEAVDLDAWRGEGIIGVEDGGAGDVRPLLTDRRDAAQNDVVDIDGVDRGAIADRLQHLGRELDRGDFVQRTVRLAPATGCPDGVVNISFHVAFLSVGRPCRAHRIPALNVFTFT